MHAGAVLDDRTLTDRVARWRLPVRPAQVRRRTAHGRLPRPDQRRPVLAPGRFVAPSDDALVFTSPTGSPLRHGNFRRRDWLAARKAASLPALHFHDLRHTGNHLTAEAGATLRELMARMGHSTTRAALIYLHATDERQRTVADAVGTLASTAMSEAIKDQNHSASGTVVARRGKRAR